MIRQARLPAALGLAAALFAAPAMAENTDTMIELDLGALAEAADGAVALPPAVQREKIYTDITDALAARRTADDARRQEIAATLSENSPDMDTDALALAVEQTLNREREQAIDSRMRERENQETGTHNLPDNFRQSVRGCTLDGFIYRMPYNISVDTSDLRAAYDRLVQADAGNILGYSGGARFMSFLDDITDDIHTGLQDTAGEIIDDTPANILEWSDFAKRVLDPAAKDVSGPLSDVFNVTIAIHTGQPVRQGEARCAAVEGHEEPTIDVPEEEAEAPASSVSAPAPTAGTPDARP